VLELARSLDRLPRRLVVVGVEAGQFDHGAPLSEAVKAAVPSAAEAVLRVIENGQGEP
jgi:hydrogenase maturation protease